MICPACDRELPLGAVECPQCGAAIPVGPGPPVPASDDMISTVRKQLRREFQIETMLGRGGMSFVYRARELELGRQVALKVMPLLVSFDEDAADRFRREAKIAATLDHPNIVPVHRIGTTSAFLWYSMKYISGASVGELVRQEGRLDLEATVGIVEQTARALDYAHRRGIVHRDVKPANVLVDQEGWTVVCDFGIAKAFGAMPLTRTGGTVGTPGYMSPEQCFGRILDGRADQYSLAIVAYECLAGRPPFVADSVGEFVHLHCTVPPPPLRQFAPEVPPEVEEAVMRGLSKAPEDRFSSVIEFAGAMGGQVQRTPRPISIAAIPAADVALASATPETPGPFPSTSAPRRRLARLGGVAVVGLVAVLLSFALWPSRGAHAPRPTGAPVATGNQAFLAISTFPLGTLYIDGVAHGESYKTDLPIPPGRHVIRVAREGYEAYVDTIEVAAGTTIRRPDIRLKPVQP